MDQTQIKDFTQGNVMKQIVIFAWPLFLSNLLQVVYNMVDMMIVGNTLGKAGISAVAIGGDVTQLYWSYFSGKSIEAYEYAGGGNEGSSTSRGYECIDQWKR